MTKLRDRVTHWPACSDAERAIIKHGRPYTGIAKPKGFPRYRAPKQCYRNAAQIAFEDGRWSDDGVWLPHRGYRYVEGFCVWPDYDCLFAHAWITIDGKHAIDPTLGAEAIEYQYYGIEFTAKAVAEALLRNYHHGMLLIGPTH